MLIFFKVLFYSESIDIVMNFLFTSCRNMLSISVKFPLFLGMITQELHRQDIVSVAS